MPIVVVSPEDPAYGLLHPASPYHGFREDHYWCTITQFVLGARVASPEDREKLRMARDAAQATELHAAMADAPGWRAREADVLRHALLRAFEARLERRKVLIDTGDEPIEVRGVDFAVDVGPLLAEVRAVVRRRAEDREAIQCEHQTCDAVRLACEHVLGSTSLPRLRRFTGRADDYELLCVACRDRLPGAPPLRKVCADCFAAMLARKREPDVGELGVAERATSLRFEHALVRPGRLSPDDVVALAPIARHAGLWLMLDREGRLHRVDLDRATVEAVGLLPQGAVDLGAPLDLHVAPDGGLAAVAERAGRRAVVLEPVSGRVTMSLLRDDYHPEHCRFPLAFFELSGKLHLVHATAWNRLEVSDPYTAVLLTARDPLTYRSRDARPEHYLDYFHAGLKVSPDGMWVIDNGWVWQPVGVVRAFSLARWVEGSPFESEDGPSVKELCWRSYFWDGPVCWVGERTVAVWGGRKDGEDVDELTPAARIFDVESGLELRSFPGPAAGFAFDPPYLVAHDADHGAAVWDPSTGERLARDPSLSPEAYHPGSRCFLTRTGQGFRVSRCVAG